MGFDAIWESRKPYSEQLKCAPGEVNEYSEETEDVQPADVQDWNNIHVEANSMFNILEYFATETM